MKKLKAIGFWVGVMLFVLSLTLCYIGWTKYPNVRDAEEYEDIGVISFAPYQVLPEQVKNTSASSYSRRTNPTRTVYMVYYKATNGSNYKCKEEATSKSTGEDIVAAGVEIERRVLRISAEGSYITIEPKQTAESYTAGLRRKYVLMIGVSVVYIIGYGIGFLVLQKRQGVKS